MGNLQMLTSKRYRYLKIFFIFLFSGTLLFCYSCRNAAVKPTGTETVSERRRNLAPASEPLMVSKNWGIEITALRMSAAGNMVDFRYKVIDAEKAADLFKRKNKPYLIHHESGKVLTVPVTAKIGPLRSSNLPKEGKIYWLFFGNKTKLVKSGDLVTVKIGEFKADNLHVR